MIKITHILLIYSLFGASCAQKPPIEPILEPDKNAPKPIKPEKASQADPKNYWNSKNNWGAQFSMVDYSSNKTLFDDSRVDNLYKKEMPEFTKEYVLYRVSHGHSCWIYSALILLAYQLIDSGAENFASAINKFEALAKTNSKYEHFNNFTKSGNLAKFIDALKYINSRISFKDALDFMNHAGVEKVLNEGLRAFIAANMRTTGADKDAEKIEQDSLCWGFVPNAGFLAKIANVEFPGLLLQDKQISLEHAQRNEIVEADPEIKELTRRENQGEDLSQEVWDKAIYRAFDNYFKTDPNKPKVLFFRSARAYMDIAVLKSFAEEIRSGHPAKR